MKKIFRAIGTVASSRNGQEVEILRSLTEAEADPEVGPMHEVRFPDGFIGHVYADELYGAHTVTRADLATGPNGEDTIYTGPLEEAIAFIRKDRATSINHRPATGRYTVFIGYTDAEYPTEETAAEWGVGETEEEAWRYALGAAFGPDDEEFTPVDLSL